MRLLVKEAVGPVEGQLVIPCSKYHAHRALILASLAPGTTTIKGLSDAGHVRHTISALRRLGTRIDIHGEEFVVQGGQYSPTPPGSSSKRRRAGDRPQEVSVGSSGTTLYFMTGLVSLADSPVTVVGQKYFQRRPIGPLLEALSALGVQLRSPTNCPPIAVAPRRPTGGRVRIAGTLSQWISGLLLLAPFATGPSRIEVEGEFNERSYVDLTIRMMAQFGLHVEVAPDGRSFEVEPNQQARPTTLTLPPDIGSAAFGLAATALHPADVLFRGLPFAPADQVDHPEADLLQIVADMGIPMTRDPDTGFVRVRHDGIALSPVEIDCRSVPDMLPVLSVLSAFAEGTTTLRNVAHVRLKESDRVSAMLQLNRMGANLEQRDDELLVHGVGMRRLTGTDLSSFNDHRVLMSLAVASTKAESESRLTYPSAYRISYPRFLDEMNGIGLFMSTAPGDGRHAAAELVAAATPTPSRAVLTPVADLVRRWAKRRPTDAAVIDVGAGGEGQERTWTWRQLDEQVDAVASMLLELGVAPGEPVAYQLPNRGEFVVLAMAIARIGAVSCPLMPIFRQREMAFMLRRSKARVFVVPAAFRGRDYPAEVSALLGASERHLADPTQVPAHEDRPPRLAHVLVLDAGGALPAGPTNGVRWHDFEATVARQKPDRKALDARRPERTALAQLLFTSGTSGEPKGVLHRMDALTRAATMQLRHLGLTPQDKVYIPTPLAHQTGFLYGMWTAMLLGAPQILQPIWDARVGLDTLRRFGGTFVQAATPFLSDLVDVVEQTGEVPEALRIFVATGAAVPRGLAERATRVLGAAVCGAWGSTESCLGSLSAPGDEPAKVWGTDGRALADVKLRITDDDGNELAPGQEGNFEVYSRCLFEGYLDHPEWTADALTPDGYYRSGDLAVIDESGYVHISGRVKDVVNRGGEKVPVAEIEQLLYTHPAVRDVAIVAMPDPRLGERACAFLVFADGARLDMPAVQRFLDERQVAKQYWPERLEFVSQLPRNPTGKVQKFLLRQQIQQLIEDEGRK